jgi:catechol 2,3-dioxygenase-like lactoylglutathione lyase family enzyme
MRPVARRVGGVVGGTFRGWRHPIQHHCEHPVTVPDYKAKTLSPIIPVADVQRSIHFYTEILGFVVALQSDDYSIVTRGGASLHLTRAADQSVLDHTRGHTSIYLEVEAIESLWSHVAQFKDRYKIRDLFDREYGMREFHIIDPDDCLVFVGARIHSP